MPSLVGLAHSDPRLDPAYLFLRAAAKRGGAVGAVVSDHGETVGCLYAIEDCIRGTRSGIFSIGDRTGAGLLLASPAHQRLVFHYGLGALLSLASTRSRSTRSMRRSVRGASRARSMKSPIITP